MKSLILLVSLLSVPCLATSLDTTPTVGGTTTIKPTSETRDCQVQNGPGVIMYGLCYKEGDTVIFKSCVEFTCRLDKDVVAGPLDAGQTGCIKDKDPKKFKEEALAEHKVSSLAKIHNCGYGSKKRGEE